MGISTGISFNKVGISADDSASIDAFGGFRVSNPETLFDSKNIFNDEGIITTLENIPLFFDNAETSGTGTSTEYRVNQAAQRISVSTAAGTRVRQTKRRFNYQPGKSQLMICTFNFLSLDEGITKRAGYFDGSNGIFLETVGDVASVVTRTFTSGSAVENRVTQANWNVDKFNGLGPSGITLDLTKTHILFIDMEWLGVGRVRIGFVIAGVIYYAHEFLNANVQTLVYMSTPNLPVRYEVSNDGTGVASNLDCICCSVISEGGQQDSGQVRYAGSLTACNANVAGTIYAVIGIRLKSNYIGQTINLINLALTEVTSATELQWFLKFNPTVADTFTYTGEPNSAIEVARGDTANTVTGGVNVAGGFFSSTNRGAEISTALTSALTLGSLINGTVDQIVLCVTPLPGNSNADVFGGIEWRELT